eukprot:724667-Pyramimonas_sp.AAC.1
MSRPRQPLARAMLASLREGHCCDVHPHSHLPGDARRCSVLRLIARRRIHRQQLEPLLEHAVGEIPQGAR